MENIRGFKVFNPDWTCRGFQYEVGKVYEEDVKPSVCNQGFHFCKQAKDCFNYYSFDPNNKVAEVIALGEVAEEGDKCSTNKIKIVREISWEELLTIVNTGKGNTGLCNSGNRNSGNWNSGNRNSGNYNSGNYNSGDWNSGNRNSGDCNSGDWNSGYYNSGDHNSGNYNSGNRNSGNRNSGHYNSGDYNSGYYNSGDHNSGNWNSGNWNQGSFCTGDFNISNNETGCFCTEEHKIRFFDKESDMTFELWRNSEAYRILRKMPFESIKWIGAYDMTDEEKNEHPEYKTIGGYLKNCDNTNCKQEWWDGLTQHEKQVIMNIPNFDAEKFFKITSIKVK